MVRDTSKDYDHMVGYVAEENLNRASISDFIGEEKEEYKPQVKKKEIDPDFPEEWQKLYVNFTSMEMYHEFMHKIGEKPVPKLKDVVYKQKTDDSILLNFLE
jgi:hypothetical protein